MVVRKMKEKCKDAARMRREKERTEFVELSKLLPLPSSTTSQLDKASIIRLTSSYLRMRAAFPDGLGEHWGTHNKHTTGANLPPSSFRAPPPIQQQQQQQIKELGSLILQTLDGFVFALHKDGKIMYISETASVHLGLPQIDLTGSSIYEYIHPTDCNDINELFSLSEADKQQLELKSKSSSLGSSGVQQLEIGRSFCMRMKCILPKRNAGLVSNGYKAIHCNGYMKVQCVQQKQNNKDSSSENNSSSAKNKSIVGADNSTTTSIEQEKGSSNNNSNNQWEAYALVAVGHSLLPSASTEVKLGPSSFMFRASLDLKLYQIESVIFHLIGLDQTEMIGQSLYQFVHVDDVKHLAEAHKLVLSKGQAVTKYYRLMRRDGGFIWIESHATLINNPRSMPKPQHIVSVCYVIGHNHLDHSMMEHNQPQPQQQQQHQRQQASFSTTLVTTTTDAKMKANSSIHGQQQIVGATNKPISSPTKSAATRKREHLEAIQPPIVKKMRKQSTFKINLHMDNNNHHERQYNTIGSTRRPSDDSCSIVSNITSASVSSSSSSCGSSSSSSSSYLANYDLSLMPFTQHQPYDAINSAAATIDSRSTLVDSSDQLEQQQIWLVPMPEQHNQEDQHHHVAAGPNAFITTSASGYVMDYLNHHALSSQQQQLIDHNHHQLHNHPNQQSSTGWFAMEQQVISCNDNNNNDDSLKTEQQYSYNSQHLEAASYHQLSGEQQQHHQHHHQLESGFNYNTQYITHVNDSLSTMTSTTTYIETEDCCPITEIQCQHHHDHNHYQHAICLNDRYATTTMQIT